MGFILLYRPSSPLNSRSYRSPISLMWLPICDRETSLRARLGDCILHASLYRLLLNPLPQACKIRLAHRLDRE